MFITQNNREPSFTRSFLFGGTAHAFEVFLGGHVLDRIKVHSEAYGSTASITKNARQIIGRGGIWSLYKGFRWNVLLSFCKGSHGWVINNFSNRLIDSMIPNSKRDSLLFSLSVSITTAVIEGTLIITPLERMKIVEMTSERSKIVSAFHCFKNYGPQFFFVGLHSVVFRQSITWASYLCFYDKYKIALESYKSEKPITLINKIGVALLTGASVCLVNAPIDFYKTQKQMFYSLPKNTSLENIKYLLSQYGLRAFYSNLRVKMLRSSFSCVVVMSTLDYAHALPRSMRIA